MSTFGYVLHIFLLVLLAAALVQATFGKRPGRKRRFSFRSGLFGRFELFEQTSLTRGVVNHLSAITDLNLPLGPALACAGRGEPGSVGRVLRRMAEAVEQGLPLSVALHRANPNCPPSVATVIAAGEQAGQLPRALADLQVTLDDELRAEASVPSGLRRYWLYPLTIILITALVVALVMVLVMPKFREIFIDFEAELPAVTLSLMGISEWLVDGPGVVLAAAALALLLVTAAGNGLALRGPSETMTRAILDTCGWIPGLTRPVEFGKGMSVAVRVVRMSLAAGMTLPAASELAASVAVNRYVRRRWEHFTSLIRGGELASRAARQAGLGNVFAWACRSLERGKADTEAILAHAADYHRAIALRWWRALSRMAWPAVTCLLGCVVGYVVLALFLPLVTLINSVSETVP